METRRTLRPFISSLTGHLRWLLRSRRTRRLDAQAMAIADRYGMRKEYLAARKFGFGPLEALEDMPTKGVDKWFIYKSFIVFDNQKTVNNVRVYKK